MNLKQICTEEIPGSKLGVDTVLVHLAGSLDDQEAAIVCYCDNWKFLPVFVMP